MKKLLVRFYLIKLPVPTGYGGFKWPEIDEVLDHNERVDLIRVAVVLALAILAAWFVLTLFLGALPVDTYNLINSEGRHGLD